MPTEKVVQPGAELRARLPKNTTFKLRVEGTIVEIDPLKLTGLEQRSIERMTGYPFLEALAHWGPGPVMIAFLYVGLKRQGGNVGTEDEFAESWTLDRMLDVEEYKTVADPTPAPASENGAGNPEPTLSDSRDLDAIGSLTIPGSTAYNPGTSSD